MRALVLAALLALAACGTSQPCQFNRFLVDPTCH